MERFNMYCSAALRYNSFDNLVSICNEMDGQLAWFDTTQEFTALMGRLSNYTDDFDGYITTGAYVHVRWFTLGAYMLCLTNGSYLLCLTNGSYLLCLTTGTC